MSNIYQILTEEDVDDIFYNNPNKIIVLMFSQKKCVHSCKIKGKFLTLAKNSPSSFFIFIDVESFQKKTDKFDFINHTPTFLYYFDNKLLITIEGASSNNNEIEETYNMLSQKIANLQDKITKTPQKSLFEKTSESSNKIKTLSPDINDDQILQTKINLLKKLKIFADAGFNLRHNYSLANSLEDMYNEIEYLNDHINIHNKNNFVQNNEIIEEYNASTDNFILNSKSPEKFKDQNIIDKDKESSIHTNHLVVCPNPRKTKKEKIEEILQLDKYYQYIQLQYLKKLEQMKLLQNIKKDMERNA